MQQLLPVNGLLDPPFPDLPYPSQIYPSQIYPTLPKITLPRISESTFDHCILDSEIAPSVTQNFSMHDSMNLQTSTDDQDDVVITGTDSPSPKIFG